MTYANLPGNLEKIQEVMESAGVGGRVITQIDDEKIRIEFETGGDRELFIRKSIGKDIDLLK
jgi:hypothetical protein